MKYKNKKIRLVLKFIKYDTCVTMLNEIEVVH